MKLSIALSLLISAVSAAHESMAMPSVTSSATSPTATSEPKTGGDIDILQYALILEHLENKFYREGLQKFGEKEFKDFGLDSKTVHDRFLEIASHEETHVTALNKTLTSLGANPVPPCEYDFGMTDAKAFVSTARNLETIGASAYLGRVEEVSTNAYKTVAVSISLIEARHSSFLNTLNKLSGFGNSFETPLSARSVVTLASPFIKSCPFEIPIKGFPALKLNRMSASAYDELYFSKSNATYCSFSVGLTSVWVEVKSNTTCVVPETVFGDVFVHLTSDNSTLLSKDTSVVSGPALVNIKMSEEMMKKMKKDEYLVSSGYVLKTSLFTAIMAILFM